MKDFKTIKGISRSVANLDVTMPGVTEISFYYTHEYSDVYIPSVYANGYRLDVTMDGTLHHPGRSRSEREVFLPQGRGLKYIQEQFELFWQDCSGKK